MKILNVLIISALLLFGVVKAQEPTRALVEKANSSLQKQDTLTQQTINKLDNKISNIDKRTTELEDNCVKKSKNYRFDGFTFQIDVYSIIISIVLVFVIYIILKLIFGNIEDSEEISKPKIKTIKQICDEQIRLRGGSNDSYNNVKSLSGEIEILKAEINKLNIKIENSKAPFEIIQPTYDTQPLQEPKEFEIKPAIETFYLSTPNSDGSFNESSALANFKDGASIYRFTKITYNRAKFQIDEKEPAIRLALQYPDKNIDPVCEAVNAFNPKASRILTDVPGEAELVNGKWQVSKPQKAKIRYEN